MIGDISFLLENYWLYFLWGLASTIILSTIGTLAGLFLGVFLALGKKMKISKKDPWYFKAPKWLIKGFSNIYSTLIRGTPMMVQAIIFKYGSQLAGVNWNRILPSAFHPILNGWLFAGLIVITLNTAAYMGEVVISGLNGVDQGEIEGARSLGMSRMSAFWHVSFPQAIRNSIPTIGNEWIVNIKDSSVLNVIGVTELYFQAGQATSQNYMIMAGYLLTALIYLALTLLTSGLLKLLERRLSGKGAIFPRLKKEAK